MQALLTQPSQLDTAINALPHSYCQSDPGKQALQLNYQRPTTLIHMAMLCQSLPVTLPINTNQTLCHTGHASQGPDSQALPTCTHTMSPSQASRYLSKCRHTLFRHDGMYGVLIVWLQTVLDTLEHGGEMEQIVTTS